MNFAKKFISRLANAPLNRAEGAKMIAKANAQAQGGDRLGMSGNRGHEIGPFIRVHIGEDFAWRVFRVVTRDDAPEPGAAIDDAQVLCRQ